MITSYPISGMTCKGCTQLVHDALSKVTGVHKVHVDLSNAQATVETNYPIPIERFQAALADSLYQISEPAAASTVKPPSTALDDDVSEKNKALVAGYVTAVGRLEHEPLQQYLHPDFTYNGAVSYQSAREYIDMIKDHARSAVAGVLLSHEIKAIFADENECCVIYDSVTRFPGREVPFVEWIKIKDGKIVSTDVKFNRHRMKLLMQEMSHEKRTS